MAGDVDMSVWLKRNQLIFFKTVLYVSLGEERRCCFITRDFQTRFGNLLSSILRGDIIHASL